MRALSAAVATTGALYILGIWFRRVRAGQGNFLLDFVLAFQLGNAIFAIGRVVGWWD